MTISIENKQPQSATRERPVMSVVRFVKNGEAKNIGAVWDNGLPSGALTMRLDLTEIDTEAPVIRLTVFPKESFARKVVYGLLTEIEHRIRSRMEAPEKPDPRLPPLFKCVLYVETTNATTGEVTTERREVGAFWPNYASGDMDLQLRLHVIPKEMLPKITLLVFPHRRRLEMSGQAQNKPGPVGSDMKEVA